MGDFCITAVQKCQINFESFNRNGCRSVRWLKILCNRNTCRWFTINPFVLTASLWWCSDRIVKDLPQAYNVQWKISCRMTLSSIAIHSKHSKQLKYEWFTTFCNRSIPLTHPYISRENKHQRSIGDLLTHFRWKTSIVICIWNKITYFYQLPLYLVSLSSNRITNPLLLPSPVHLRPDIIANLNFQFSQKHTQFQVEAYVSATFSFEDCLRVVFIWHSLGIYFSTDHQYWKQIESEYYSADEIYHRIEFDITESVTDQSLLACRRWNSVNETSFYDRRKNHLTWL